MTDKTRKIQFKKIKQKNLKKKFVRNLECHLSIYYLQDFSRNQSIKDDTKDFEEIFDFAGGEKWIQKSITWSF